MVRDRSFHIGPARINHTRNVGPEIALRDLGQVDSRACRRTEGGAAEARQRSTISGRLCVGSRLPISGLNTFLDKFTPLYSSLSPTPNALAQPNRLLRIISSYVSPSTRRRRTSTCNSKGVILLVGVARLCQDDEWSRRLYISSCFWHDQAGFSPLRKKRNRTPPPSAQPTFANPRLVRHAHDLVQLYPVLLATLTIGVVSTTCTAGQFFTIEV
jgi:hypothetical protein